MHRILLVPALALACVAGGLALPRIAYAADELSNGAVTPPEGTTKTVFTFSVDYAGNPTDVPTVVARVGSTEVPLGLVSGIPGAGTYAGSATLPAGSWQVQFRADNLRGGNAVHNGPSVVVRDATAAPQPTPAPPAPTPTPVPAPVTPAPTATPSPTPTLSPSPEETPGGALLPRSRSARPTPSASATPSAASAGGRLGTGSLVLLFVGGTMAGTGAAILGVLWAARRTDSRTVSRSPGRSPRLVPRQARVPVARRGPLSR